MKKKALIITTLICAIICVLGCIEYDWSMTWCFVGSVIAIAYITGAASIYDDI